DGAAEVRPGLHGPDIAHRHRQRPCLAGRTAGPLAVDGARPRAQRRTGGNPPIPVIDDGGAAGGRHRGAPRTRRQEADRSSPRQHHRRRSHSHRAARRSFLRHAGGGISPAAGLALTAREPENSVPYRTHCPKLVALGTLTAYATVSFAGFQGANAWETLPCSCPRGTMSMPARSRIIKGNRLLGSLSRRDRGLLAKHLVPLELPLRHVFERPNKAIADVYFPETGIASIVAQHP